ncbi:hypothetical protein EBZ38_08750 [bacterium]|nr:hypothetical protein [bacterium]
MGEPVVEGNFDFNEFQLLQGEVKEIIYPNDNKSLSKTYIEYNVAVQHKTSGGPTSTVIYPNCLLVNSFGGIADKVSYSLRADPKEPTGKNVSTTGSKVLLLCISGVRSQAYIIGGIRDDAQKDPNGHHFLFQFNGVSFAINNDGEAKLVFRGATDVSNDLRSNVDKNASPTTVSITKNGNLKISTKDDAQFLHIDHENKKIEVLADTEWNVKVNEKATFDFGKNWDANVGGALSCSIQENVNLNTSSGKIDIGASGNVSIKSAGLLVGNATDSMMKGTTYRNAEANKNSQLISALGQLAGYLTTAGIGITTASGLHSVPIAGPIAGAAPLAAAATALASAATAVSQMISAITSFESQSFTYLSTVNKND